MSSERLEKNWTRITAVWVTLAYALVSGFWLVWYLVNGEIPGLRELVMKVANEKSGAAAWVIPLPFAVSRAWDAFLVPLFVLAFCRLWRRVEETGAAKRDDLFAGLLFGLAVGLVGGLIAGLGYGLVFGPVFGLAVGLIAGLVAGLGYGVTISIGFGCVVGWGFTLIIWTPLLAVWLLVLACRGTKNWFQSSSGSRAELEKLLSGQT